MESVIEISSEKAPRHFDEVVGHRPILDALVRAFASGRGHHAYLFSGPDGVGKRSVANILGQSMLCQEGVIGRPCGRCGPCSRVAAGSHADWIVVSPEGERIKIETIRKLNHDFNFRPFEGGARVVLIEAADHMTPEAANALLKTLEEPPAGSSFILTANNHAQVLPTVVSRCQHLPFSALGADDVATVMRRVAPDLEAEAMASAAVFSGGSPGHALALLDDPVFLARGEIMGQFLGLVTQESSPVGFGDWAELRDPRPTENRGKLAQQRFILRGVLALLNLLVRDLMVARSGGAESHLLNSTLREQLVEAGGRLTWDGLSAILRAIREAGAAVDGNVTPRLILETLAIRVSDSTMN